MFERRQSSTEVTRLIDRIRKLVAEKQRLEHREGSDRAAANTREIARLQRRLAMVVKRELTQ